MKNELNKSNIAEFNNITNQFYDALLIKFVMNYGKEPYIEIIIKCAISNAWGNISLYLYGVNSIHIKENNLEWNVITQGITVQLIADNFILYFDDVPLDENISVEEQTINFISAQKIYWEFREDR